MCAGQNDGMRFPDMLRDPLIRLVIKSDGVTEHGDLTGCQQCPEQHRRRLRRRQHGLRLDAAFELLVQSLDGIGGACRPPLVRLTTSLPTAPLNSAPECTPNPARVSVRDRDRRPRSPPLPASSSAHSVAALRCAIPGSPRPCCSVVRMARSSMSPCGRAVPLPPCHPGPA